MTRLGELNPIITQGQNCPTRLRFVCPLCGPPYTIDIPININGRTPHDKVPQWAFACAEPPGFSWDTVTISPSIDNSPGGHGRKKPCSWHGNIINGEIHP